MLNFREHIIKADLHIHTTASDGMFTPVEIIRMAESAGLSYISITDHDTVDGLLCLANSPIALTLIPGIEFSVDIEDSEVHILGYDIDITNIELQSELEKLKNYRIARIKEIINKINSLGYKLEYERLLIDSNNSSSLGRSHIAKLLVKDCYFSSVSEVFNKLLLKNKPAYVPHYPNDAGHVINLIKRIGGISILAHPGLVTSNKIVLDVINAGICGLEVYHPAHTPENIAKYCLLAKKSKLMITGGSDFHGIINRYPEELGLFYVPARITSFLNAKN